MSHLLAKRKSRKLSKQNRKRWAKLSRGIPKYKMMEGREWKRSYGGIGTKAYCQADIDREEKATGRPYHYYYRILEETNADGKKVFVLWVSPKNRKKW